MIIDSPIISGSYAASGSLNQFGNVVISGSLTVTGSIIGTASVATSASYAATASYASNVPVTASYALTASQAVTASYLSGYVSPFPFTGSAIISGSLGVTGSLKVTNLSGSGVRYLVTDESGSIIAQSASAALKSTQAFTATAGQTTFSVTNGYSTGYVDVFINGSKLSAAEFTDTSGTDVILATGSFSGDVVEVVKYIPAAGVTNNVLRQLTTFTASAGQTVFSASYTPGLLDIYYNGSRLSTSDYTANNGTYFTLATASVANDILDVLVYSYQVGGFSGIGGQGVTSQIAYFNATSSITGSNNFTISGSTMTVTGSLTVSGSGTFTNIGPAVLSGSVSVSGSIVLNNSNVVLANQTSSLSVSTASYAATASYANTFTVASTLTAQTLVVQTITSSVVYSSGSNIFGNAVGNTQVFTGSVYMNPGGLFVSSSGLVGIGTTVPAYTLDVTGNGRVTNTLLVNTTDNSSGAKLQVSGSINFKSNSGYNGWIISQTGGNSSAAFNLSYGAGGASNVITAQYDTGYVGIGTSSPLSTLDVSAASPTITIRNNQQKNWNSGDQIGYLDQYIDDTSSAGARTVSYVRSIVGNGVTNGVTVASSLIFGTAAYDATATERMRIESNGYVGIGTTNPGQLLTIFKGQNADTATGIYNQTDGTTSSTTLRLDNGSYNGQLNLYANSYTTSGTATANALRLYTDGPGGMNFSATNQHIRFYTSPSEVNRLTILYGGNVGIGTGNPSQKLEVNGTAKASKYITNESTVSVSSTATTIFDLGQATGVWIVTAIVLGNPQQAGYAIVGMRSGTSLYLLNTANGGQMTFSVSGTALQLSQSAGGSINTVVNYIALNLG